jgi:RNA polymerase sigma factor (sigma-70 family)
VSVSPKLAPDGQAHRPVERLIAECLSGDEGAWSELIDRYKNLIYSVPIKLGIYDEAPDIFQAVCLDLLSGLAQLREPRALPKWLMQTCYHKCLQYRTNTEKHSPITDQAHAEHDSELLMPQQILEELEKEQNIRDAILQLNPRCERMVRMLFFEDPPRPYQEVAREFGIATGSIGFIRSRCLHRLRKQLEKLGF